MESKYGVQFTSREWTYDKTTLTLGHYCGNDYAAAKKDFALRAGFVPEEKRFTPEQLVEIYDESIVCQMIECIKVYPNGKLDIIFGGGYIVEESINAE